MKAITFLVAIGLSLCMVKARANDNTNESSLTSPRDMVIALFDAMRAGDGQAIRNMVVAEARLDRLRPDQSLQQGTFERWISWVDTLEAGQADEQVFALKVTSSSPELVTVWAPFELTFKGKFVGCGVNQFNLVNTNEGWKFVYGIDKPYKGDCVQFKHKLLQSQANG